jgi:acetyl-CoA C-acetyltransferase
MDERTPVLVGLGMVEQREENPLHAVETLELMRSAVMAAGTDAGAPALLSRVGLIAIPRGQWHYGDPGRILATEIGAAGATSVLAHVGILQQTIIGQACARIADGEVDAALVVGGETRYRTLRARILGVDLPVTDDDGNPDVVMQFSGDLVLQSEYLGGLGGMPVGYYAIIESALRAVEGRTVDDHRDRVAALYSRFSEIAASNPHAWKRDPVAATAIRDASEKNPMLAFPYTKLHNSSWNVDQATALLLCSVKVARELKIERDRWVFPLASVESNHALALSERPVLSEVPGVRLAGQRAFDIAGRKPDELDFVELYSCFPIAVQTHARELGVRNDVDWTVTGGMPFAGGPFNSYVLQSTGRMIELLRGGPDGATGIVTAVSGLLTKHAVAVWSTEPGPNPFAAVDVAADVAAITPGRAVAVDVSGPATIAGYTVLPTDDGGTRGVALLDLEGGERGIAHSTESSVIAEMEATECCGRAVTAEAGTLQF